MSANLKTAAPTGRKNVAQGKERSDAALGYGSQNTASPEGAKEGSELPEGWRWVNLPDIGELSRGKSKHRPRNYPKLYGGPYPFIQTGNIRESGGTIRKHTQTYSDLGLSQSRLWPTGTLCITIAANIGETGILAYPACFPDSVVGFRHDGDSVTVRFIELYFRIAKAELERLAPATAQKNINVDILSKLRVPLPPLPEQRRIVAEIEKQFTRLEAGAAAIRRVQANLKRYRAAVLKAACEGRLVPTEAEFAKSANQEVKYETGDELLARILTERRQDWQGRGKYEVPAEPNTANLPPLPNSWAWVTIEQLLRNNSGLGYGILKPGEEDPNGVPMVRVMDIGDGKLAGTEIVKVEARLSEEFSRTILESGDIMLAVMATVGRCAVVPEHLVGANVNRALAVIKPTRLVPSKFLELAIRSPRLQHLFQKNKIGSAQARINLSDLRTYCLPLPPLAEQTRIVAEVERRLSVVEELEAVVSANLQRATRLRESILQRAFSGRLATAEAFG